MLFLLGHDKLIVVSPKLIMNIVEWAKAGLEERNFLTVEEALVYAAQQLKKHKKISAPGTVGDIEFLGRPRRLASTMFGKVVALLLEDKAIDSFSMRNQPGPGRSRIFYEIKNTATIDQLARLR